MALTTYGNISQRTAAYAVADMLAHAEPIFVLSKFGQTKECPQNKADTMKFRRPTPFPITTTLMGGLTEGVTPAEQSMQYEDRTVIMKQYGSFTKISDKICDLAEDPVMADASMLSGEQAGEVKELLLWGTLKAGTAVGYSNGAARNAVNTPPGVSKFQAAIRVLNAQRAKKITTMMSSSPNYGTVSVDGGYIAFCHTDMDYDLEAMPGFKKVADYGTRQPLCPEELGSLGKIRFITSPLLAPWLGATGVVGGATSTMKNTAGFADVYPIVIVSKDAYAHVPLKGKSSIVPKVMNPDTLDRTDPLGQWGFVSWKMWDASLILNELWMYRLECAATLL
ncbi:MAG: N4-gp56 family major capsid protein [Chlorobium sp.]|nr:N4-gp56 family major capsid protein [Chlorobium sp.]